MTSAALRAPALLLRAVAYEFRKRIQFRAGFFVREVLNGTVEPLVMLFVYTALYGSAAAIAGPGAGSEVGSDPGSDPGAAAVALGGWTYPEIIQYVAGLVVVRKLIFHSRALDLATEIFEGRVTKYLVMPFRFFVLHQGRFLQFTLMQVVVAGLVWLIGYAVAPDHWLVPVSAAATLQAGTLVLMGSYCCFLIFFTLNAMAFWLDVVWSLLVMAWFVIGFTGGALVPVSQMPAAFYGVLSFGFPYWMITAPIELLMGRLGTEDFLFGAALVAVQLVALEVLRRWVWRRGLARYVGAGM